MKLNDPCYYVSCSGKHLWPLSRKYNPKQFIALFDDNAAPQNTLICLDSDAFTACSVGFIEYALMDKHIRPLLYQLDAGWDDAGSWSSLWECAE